MTSEHSQGGQELKSEIEILGLKVGRSPLFYLKPSVSVGSVVFNEYEATWFKVLVWDSLSWSAEYIFQVNQSIMLPSSQRAACPESLLPFQLLWAMRKQ